MLDVAVTEASPWPAPDGGGDWEARAGAAAAAALAATPYAALGDAALSVEIAVRLTGDAEVQALNASYRGKDKPTNVLSFAMLEPEMFAVVDPDSDGELLLGDIVLARETCAREAADKGIAMTAHATHLIVHGTLHLLGYDHLEDDEAEAMEQLEREVLHALGIDDPYAIIEDDD